MSEIFPTISLEKLTTHLYFKLSDYFRKNFRKILYSVQKSLMKVGCIVLSNGECNLMDSIMEHLWNCTNDYVMDCKVYNPLDGNVQLVQYCASTEHWFSVPAMYHMVGILHETWCGAVRTPKCKSVTVLPLPLNQHSPLTPTHTERNIKGNSTISMSKPELLGNSSWKILISFYNNSGIQFKMVLPFDRTVLWKTIQQACENSSIYL